MKLSKALKVKNRLKGDVVRLQRILARENSRNSESTSKVDREASWKELIAVTDKLVGVKSAIAAANVPIYANIENMAELKARIAFLRTLDTKDGTFDESVGYARETKSVTYNAFFTAESVDAEIKEIEVEVERLQDVIDEFNASTEVTIAP